MSAHCLLWLIYWKKAEGMFNYFDRKSETLYKFSYVNFIVRKKLCIYQLANILHFCPVSITIFLMTLFLKCINYNG